MRPIRASASLVGAVVLGLLFLFIQKRLRIIALRLGLETARSTNLQATVREARQVASTVDAV